MKNKGVLAGIFFAAAGILSAHAAPAIGADIRTVPEYKEHVKFPNTIIVNKAENTATVVENYVVVFNTTVLTGKNNSDEMVQNATPAATFPLLERTGNTYENSSMCFLDEGPNKDDPCWAIHPVMPGKDRQARLNALAGESVKARRMTGGCVVFVRDDYIYVANFAEKHRNLDTGDVAYLTVMPSSP